MQKTSATRIALLRLKKELKTARRGHKLLKDKRDGLVRVFIDTAKEAIAVRRRVAEKLGKAFAAYTTAEAMIPTSVLSTAFLLPGARVRVEAEEERIMSVSVPKFSVHKEGSAFSYGFLETTGDLDTAIFAFDDVFADIVSLAAIEKKARLLAAEIEKTRRRVAALEHIRIPSLEERIRFVAIQLDERARDAIVSTMRVKDMIVRKEESTGYPQ